MQYGDSAHLTAQFIDKHECYNEAAGGHIMEALEGHTIEHYRILHRLTRGGMSDIYLAEDTQTKRLVVIKMVHTSNHEYCERFHGEIQATTILQHDHILPVLAYGEYQSWCYMISPYIADGTLNNRLAAGPLSLHETGQILEQLVSALQFAHDYGIIHRDLKPSNILLHNKEHVYLADFGLARSIAKNDGLTVTGHLIGTPEYMAPELAEEPATISSDIYALGVILYQLLTGQVPFKGSTPMGTYLKHIRERAVAPTSLNPAIPEEIEEVILRTLEKIPGHRFRSARDLANAYQRALAQSEKRAYKKQAPSSPLLTLALASTMQIPLVQKNNTHWSRLLLVATFFLMLIPGALGFTYYTLSYNASKQVILPVLQGVDVSSKQPIKQGGFVKTPGPQVTPLNKAQETPSPSGSSQVVQQITRPDNDEDDPPTPSTPQDTDRGHGHHKEKSTYLVQNVSL